MSAAVSQARRAVATAQRWLASVVGRCASESSTSLTPAAAAARAWESSRSRRSGAPLISRNVPVRAAASISADDVDAVAAALSDQAARGWPIASTSGCSIARTIRSVIASALIRKDVCTLATTQSSRASSSSS